MKGNDKTPDKKTKPEPSARSPYSPHSRNYNHRDITTRAESPNCTSTTSNFIEINLLEQNDDLNSGTAIPLIFRELV